MGLHFSSNTYSMITREHEQMSILAQCYLVFRSYSWESSLSSTSQESTTMTESKSAMVISTTMDKKPHTAQRRRKNMCMNKLFSSCLSEDSIYSVHNLPRSTLTLTILQPINESCEYLRGTY